MAALELQHQVRTMSQSPNPAASHQVAPLLALATHFLRAGRPADAITPLRDAALWGRPVSDERYLLVSSAVAE